MTLDLGFSDADFDDRYDSDEAPEDPDRWRPDDQLIPAVLAGTSRTMRDLCESDRCWAVAGLTARGHVAEDIADRLDCSLRLIRTIRSKAMTRVCEYAQKETTSFANELRLVKSGLAAEQARATEFEAALARTKTKLDNLLDTHLIGARRCGKCGTPMSGYNLWTSPNTGRTNCRECRRRRAQAFRDRAKAQFPAHNPGPQTVTPNAVTHTVLDVTRGLGLSAPISADAGPGRD